MNEPTNRYENFLSSWEPVFQRIPSILNILSSYPELCKKIKFLSPRNLDHLHDIQKEWISVISRFDNPIETSFFKEYHVPVEKDSYDYFIDLSSDRLPIFLLNFYQSEPYHWYRSIVFNDVNELMNALHIGSFDVVAHFKEFWLEERFLVNQKIEHSELMQSQDNWEKFSIKKSETTAKDDQSKHQFN